MGGLEPPHRALVPFKTNSASMEPVPSTAFPWNVLLAQIRPPTGISFPAFIFQEKWVSISSLPLWVLGRKDGISVGGSGFPNGYAGGWGNKPNKTTVTKNLHPPTYPCGHKVYMCYSGKDFFF